MDAFTYALRERLKTHGEVSSFYGPWSISHHVRSTSCGGWVIPVGAKAQQDYSYEFAGTDADPQARQVIKLDTLVDCECGEYKRRNPHLEGTFSELLTLLLKIDVPKIVEF